MTLYTGGPQTWALWIGLVVTAIAFILPDTVVWPTRVLRRLLWGVATASLLVLVAAVLISCPVWLPNCCSDWVWCWLYSCCW